MNAIRLLLCCFLLTASSACAVRSHGNDGHGDDDQPNPNPQPVCEEDNDCNSPPSACDVGTCSRGACSYVSSCNSGETCNPQGHCEEPWTPPPPPPSGHGTIFCSDPTGSSQTNIVISNGILAHLIGGSGLNPNGNWSVRFGTGSVGTDAKSWVSDTSSYSLTVTNTATLFNFVLQDPNGQQYWFDLNEFDVSGTCSHATDATSITHVVPGGNPNPDPGNGTISCADVLNGQFVDVTISTVAAHLKKSDGSGQDADGTVTPNSAYWLRWGSDQAGWGIVNPYDALKDQEQWVDGSIVLRLPGNTGTFNGALYNTNTNQVYWLDLDEYNVSGGSCSHPQGAGGITRTPTGTSNTGNGTIWCSDSGSDVNVSISNGVLAHLKKSDGSGTDADGTVFPDSSYLLRWGSDQAGWNIANPYSKTQWSWGSDTNTYTLPLPLNTVTFNVALYSSNTGAVYWFDLDEFNVSGSCSHPQGAGGITHTTGSTSTGNGTVHCTENGSQTTVTVSNGILSHLQGTPSYPAALLQFEYGGSQDLNWIGDNATYQFSMGNTITAFNFRLRDTNGNAYRFEVSEFTVTGTCSKTSSAFTHSLSTVTNVGTIKCRLWDVGGITKREVTITPNGNGIIAGTFQEGTPVTSPESIRLNVDGQQQTWVGNGQPHIFYPLPSVNNFNFFIVDNDDVASGSDTVSGGDWFNLAAWTVTNETTQYGTSNCHVSGGGIVVN